MDNSLLQRITPIVAIANPTLSFEHQKSAP